MAKYTSGPTVAAVSGSVGGTTYSRNRYGQYMRQRSIPTVSTTTYALAAKARLEAVSMAWQALDTAQKIAWRMYAEQNPVQDSLGVTQILTAHTTYVSLNTRMHLLGNALIADPPITPTPNPLTALSLSADIGVGDFDLVFAPTPTGAAEMLYIRGCVIDSPGVAYVQNYLRYLGVSTVAQATPFDPQSIIEARFGTLIVDQTVHLEVSIIDNLSGQVSRPLKCSDLVEETTV